MTTQNRIPEPHPDVLIRQKSDHYYETDYQTNKNRPHHHHHMCHRCHIEEGDDKSWLKAVYQKFSKSFVQRKPRKKRWRHPVALIAIALTLVCFFSFTNGAGLLTCSYSPPDTVIHGNSAWAPLGLGARSLLSQENADENKSVNGTPQAQFPEDLFTLEQRRQGAVVLHVLGLVYMFVALAIVCDEFFVPSLDVITDKLGISEDVAGATFMAAGGSAPELFTSVIGVFISFDDVGIGTIVGSAVFNILFVISMCAIFSKSVLELTWWPLFRDCSFYSISLIILMVFFRDNTIYWWEALILLMCYVSYVSFMKFNEPIEKLVKKVINRNKVTRVGSTDQLMPHLARRRMSTPILHAGSKFRHGLLQLMIHTIDPLHEGKLDEKASQLHAIASLRVILDATKANGTVMTHMGPTTADGIPVNPNGRCAACSTCPACSANCTCPGILQTTSLDHMVTPNTLVVTPGSLPVSEKPSPMTAGLTTLGIPKGGSLQTMSMKSPGEVEMTRVDTMPSIQSETSLSRSHTGETAIEVQIPPTKESSTASLEPAPLPSGGEPENLAALQSEVAVVAAEKEAEEPLDIKWPDTCKSRINYILLAPIIFPLWLTLPDVRRPEKTRWFPMTFLGSIAWIAIFSYLMVWWATMVGDTVGIPNEVMGLTFLAAGTSIPDLITSVLVARKGFGDMAVSSSVGSNIFDVTVGLPLPWLLATMIFGPVHVNSGGMACSIFLLFMMLMFVIISIAVFRWRMNIGLAIVMFLLYFVFIACSLLLEYNILKCGRIISILTGRG